VTTESVVSKGMAKAVKGLRAEFKTILTYIADGTPLPGRDETNTREWDQGPDSDPDTEGDSGPESDSEQTILRTRTQPALHIQRDTTSTDRLRGTVGGRLVREDPIVVDTPKPARRVRVGAGGGSEKGTSEDPVELETPRKRDKDPVMPGSFDIDLSQERLVTSYNPTPAPNHTHSPLTPCDPELIRALHDEINIGFIANKVPMDPEFTPEPPENREGIKNSTLVQEAGSGAGIEGHERDGQGSRSRESREEEELR